MNFGNLAKQATFEKPFSLWTVFRKIAEMLGKSIVK